VENFRESVANLCVRLYPCKIVANINNMCNMSHVSKLKCASASLHVTRWHTAHPHVTRMDGKTVARHVAQDRARHKAARKAFKFQPVPVSNEAASSDRWCPHSQEQRNARHSTTRNAAGA
jgi:hypothetical protein